MTRLFATICLVSLIIVIGTMLSGNPSTAQSEKASAEPTPSREELRAAQFDRLLRMAAEKGRVRVIVGLDVDFIPEGELSNPAKADQRERIRNSQERLWARVKDHAASDKKVFEFIPFMALEVDASALEAMRVDPEVVSIQEDELSDPALAESSAQVTAPQAWSAGWTGSNWAVAVLDTGVNKNHTFLAGKVVSEACYSSNTTSATSFCPGGATSSTAVNSGLNCDPAINGCPHGTHVAGIVAGTNTSMSGVARGGNIIAVQVFSRFANSADCGTAAPPCVRSYTSDQILGLQRVQALSSSMNIASVNMSLGGGSNTINCDAAQAATKAAIDSLRSVNVATVIASGNDGFTNAIASPACISTAVSVGSVGDGSLGATADVVSSFSNSASILNLLAPGQWINSSVAATGSNSSFSNYSGTSMATPHVAGAWAVIRQAAPNATVTQVLNALSSTGVSITDTRNGIVKPRIRVFNALQTLVPTCTYSLSPPSATFGSAGGSGSFVVNTQAGCAWTTSVSAPFADVLFGWAAGSEGSEAQISPSTVFLNSTPIIINDRPANTSPPGTASVYPSNITVSGMTGTITGVDVALNNLSHTFPNDIDVVLVSPGGTRVAVLSDAGGAGAATGVNLTLTGTGTPVPPAGPLVSGTFQASNYTGNTTWEPGGTDNFPAPGPGSAVYSSTLSSFNGGAPNGTWSLYVVDDENADTGSITGGWALGITSSGGGSQWITVTSGGSGTGTGTVGYSVSANGTTSSRSGSISAGGQTHSITQGGAGCTYSISSPSSSLPSGPGTVTFNITTAAGCAWSASSNATSWLTTSSSGTGSGTVTFAFTQNTGTTSRTGTITVGGQQHFVTQAGASTGLRRPFDFDGDGRSDAAVYRPSNNAWYLLRSQAGFAAYQFGATGDSLVPADYTGDGKTDVAVWRPSNGTWYILRSENLTLTGGGFGQNGDIAAPGDYDADGRADMAVYRPGAQSAFYIQRTTAGFQAFSFGIAEDKPSLGDFDGDGKTDIAVYRPSQGAWYRYNSSNNSFYAVQFGAPGDKIVPGDYTGDGKADVAIFRPSNNTWYVLRSDNGTVYGGAFGASGDLPCPGDFDGDGKYDFSVYRQGAQSVFYVQQSAAGFTAIPWGLNGDRPASGAYVF